MNIDEIVKNMIEVAETSGPRTREALLSGIAGIKYIQGKHLIIEAERLLEVAKSCH